MLLDGDEFARWRRACEEELAVARLLAGAEAHNSAVLHAEQAAQLALKGLLRGAGAASQAWGHAVTDLADRAGPAAGLAVDPGLRERLAILARDYQASRYPDAVASGTPRENYGPADSTRALSTVDDLVDAVDAAWAALTDVGR
ncbi:MAG: HEPN domain-containing protein [Kineosporiaceae bacterium]